MLLMLEPVALLRCSPWSSAISFVLEYFSVFCYDSRKPDKEGLQQSQVRPPNSVQLSVKVAVNGSHAVHLRRASAVSLR